MLETVVPKTEGKVMIVMGKNSGKTGKVIKKAKDTATIQLAGDLSIDEYELDNICQYEGHDIH
jgi:hypothetical protein